MEYVFLWWVWAIRDRICLVIYRELIKRKKQDDKKIGIKRRISELF